jgi:succinyl-CoA synthetase alpha subunit
MLPPAPNFLSSRPTFLNSFGHAGVIVVRGQSAEEKEKALCEVGVMIAQRYEELVRLVIKYAV